MVLPSLSPQASMAVLRLGSTLANPGRTLWSLTAARVATPR